jgi:hypothetical protein
MFEMRIYTYSNTMRKGILRSYENEDCGAQTKFTVAIFAT